MYHYLLSKCVFIHLTVIILYKYLYEFQFLQRLRNVQLQVSTIMDKVLRLNFLS